MTIAVRPLVSWLLVLCAASFQSSASSAQLMRPGQPPGRTSVGSGLASEWPVIVAPRPDVARYLAEDERNGPFPFRYGAVLAIELDIDRHGHWESSADGTLVWRAEIASPGAHSLGVLFGQYDLPPGAELYLYAPDGSDLIGALTDANEQSNGMLGIQPHAGDRIVLEYVQGPDVVGAPRLSVESVVHDYRDILRELALDPSSDPTLQLRGPGCLVDVNCAAGAPYQDVKRAVVALYRGGFVCSGSILNNTAEDGMPYMFTADHCGNFTNGTFGFNFERPGCNSGSASVTQFLSGAQLLAADDFVDAQLYRLNNAPPASYEAFYAGWDRADQAGSPAVGISHPAGLPKKISIDNDAPVVTGQSWSLQWDVGEIQGGSSGSPLFNTSQRVIGPLCCAAGSCQTQFVSYGRFSRFWARNSLAQWLDPIGTGSQGIDGYDPNRASSTPYNGTGGNYDIYRSNLPTMGTSWVGTVDVSLFFMPSSTVLVSHQDAAAGLMFGFGELLVDVQSPLAFRSTAPVVSTTSTHTAAIPIDPALAGRVAYSQAFVFGSGYLAATNGVRLRIQ